MRLYIAEKPSVGRALAACLPQPHRKGNGCIETGAGVVTWLFGHVLRQAALAVALGAVAAQVFSQVAGDNQGLFVAGDERDVGR